MSEYLLNYVLDAVEEKKDSGGETHANSSRKEKATIGSSSVVQIGRNMRGKKPVKVRVHASKGPAEDVVSIHSSDSDVEDTQHDVGHNMDIFPNTQAIMKYGNTGKRRERKPPAEVTNREKAKKSLRKNVPEERNYGANSIGASKGKLGTKVAPAPGSAFGGRSRRGGGDSTRVWGPGRGCDKRGVNEPGARKFVLGGKESTALVPWKDDTGRKRVYDIPPMPDVELLADEEEFESLWDDDKNKEHENEAAQASPASMKKSSENAAEVGGVGHRDLDENLFRETRLNIEGMLGSEYACVRDTACAGSVGNSCLPADEDAEGACQSFPGCEIKPVDLDVFMKIQEDEMKVDNADFLHDRIEIFGTARASSRRPYGRKRRMCESKTGTRKASSRRSSMKKWTPKELWRLMICETLARYPNHFASKNALLQEHKWKSRKGKIGYPGLKISPENCPDLASVYELRYKTKELLNARGSGTFGVFRSVLGQFVRWAIASGTLPVNDGWKKRAIFNLMREEKLMRCFVNHFIRISSYHTVAGKCNALRIFCQYALIRMIDMEDRNRVAQTQMYLAGVFNSAKGAGREASRKQESAEERIMNQTIVSKKQMEKGMLLAKAKLNDIMGSFCETVAKESRKTAVRELMSTKGLVDKWCLNFLALLLLTGGGQRPQAYARLQCPRYFELEQCIDDEMENPEGMFEIRTFREKTPRALDVPNVLFPKYIMRFVAFHTDIVRPIVLKKRKLPLTNKFQRNKPLLLHSRYGTYLTSSAISRSIKSFMASVNPKLTSVTAMTLRSSFATAMLHDYRRGKFTKDGKKMDEDHFLDLVAKQMNTSVEQLRGTYMVAHSKDFKEVSALMTRHFCLVMGEDSDEEENEDDGDDGHDSRRGSDEEEESDEEDDNEEDDDEDEMDCGALLFDDEEEEDGSSEAEGAAPRDVVDRATRERANRVQPTSWRVPRRKKTAGLKRSRTTRN